MSETRINVSQTTITAEEIGASSAVDTMPIASASNLGKIVQYIGPSDGEHVAVLDPKGTFDAEDFTFDSDTFISKVGDNVEDYKFHYYQNHVAPLIICDDISDLPSAESLSIGQYAYAKWMARYYFYRVIEGSEGNEWTFDDDSYAKQIIVNSYGDLPEPTSDLLETIAYVRNDNKYYICTEPSDSEYAWVEEENYVDYITVCETHENLPTDINEHDYGEKEAYVKSEKSYYVCKFNNNTHKYEWKLDNDYNKGLIVAENYYDLPVTLLPKDINKIAYVKDEDSYYHPIEGSLSLEWGGDEDYHIDPDDPNAKWLITEKNGNETLVEDISEYGLDFNNERSFKDIIISYNGDFFIDVKNFLLESGEKRVTLDYEYYTDSDEEWNLMRLYDLSIDQETFMEKVENVIGTYVFKSNQNTGNEWVLQLNDGQYRLVDISEYGIGGVEIGGMYDNYTIVVNFTNEWPNSGVALKNGAFYKCIIDPEASNESYIWNMIPVDKPEETIINPGHLAYLTNAQEGSFLSLDSNKNTRWMDGYSICQIELLQDGWMDDTETTKIQTVNANILSYYDFVFISGVGSEWDRNVKEAIKNSKIEVEYIEPINGQKPGTIAFTCDKNNVPSGTLEIKVLILHK